MANNVVDRGANRLWEAVIVEWRRDSALNVDNVIMTDTINVTGGHAHLDTWRDHLKDLCSETTSHAHAL